MDKLTTQTVSVSDIVHCMYGCSQQHDMWQALRLAEVTKYPATSNLPSRRQTVPEIMTKNDECSKTKCVALKMKDLIGIPLNPILTTVSHTMKRTTGRSLHTIVSVTKSPHSSKQQDDKKKKKKLPQ